METRALVSVIITTYYRNDQLSECIESVLSQSYDNIEIIVVDDSGEEHAKHIVNKYNINYVPKNENEGQIAAWNTGVSYSTGSLIQFLDDDDRLSPEKIRKQVRKFKSDKQIGLVYCGLKWESGGKATPDESLRGHVLSDVLKLDTSPCTTSTMLIRRRFIERIHPIPEYPASTDDVLKIDIAPYTKFGFIDECLLIRGQNEDNVATETKFNAWIKIILIMNKHTMISHQKYVTKH
jgi:glycosyltransferase involved in cell wall biosynthesis